MNSPSPTVVAARNRVKADWTLLMQALPGLRQQHEGKWVLYRDGAVQALMTTQAEALSEGHRRYGATGFVVTQVAEKRVVRIPTIR